MSLYGQGLVLEDGEYKWNKSNKMDVYQALLSQIPQNRVDVKQVVFGLYWTVVVSQHTGMASTLASMQPHHDVPIPLAGRLVGQNAVTLADLIVSKNSLLASLGLASLNSLLHML